MQESSRRAFLRSVGQITVGGLVAASVDGCATAGLITPHEDQSMRMQETSNNSDLELILRDLTMEEKLGQLLMIPPIEKIIRDLRPGSVILRDHNVDDDMDETRRITDNLQ
ncbi:hypothetical protein ACFL1X_05155, partial [Candidatus Hydrogenedentota bacterium]